ncbi:MAG: hypothetical protein QOG98_1700, partial [Pseudonocardiales bacterium]|nr:hypothetical protein [Pseudonocardiales bacterium]
ATHTGVGLPPDHMFRATPADEDWHEQLSGQDRPAVGPEEALQVTARPGRLPNPDFWHAL